jgi:23S rRNA (adenine2503-C2)-methyltransferase
MKTNLKSLTPSELSDFIVKQGLSPFRARQINHWIYDKKAQSLDQITELSLDMRTQLSPFAYVSNLFLLKREKSREGTEKFLWQLEDGKTIESVLIPEDKRLTLCISSQVGCAMGCRFCLTGTRGFQRNLAFYEIIDQILSVQRFLNKENRLSNIVLMGMGEPLNNFDEVTKALSIMYNTLGFSKRKVTLSTVGIVPKINMLSKALSGVNLAISLNATTDKVRSEIMPINKIYPLKELLRACQHYHLSPGRRIAFEYVLLKDINDSPENARRLVSLLKRKEAKINLIPFNPFPGAEFQKPTDECITAFQEILIHGHMTATVRKSRGTDISAACGLLKGTVNVTTQAQRTI